MGFLDAPLADAKRDVLDRIAVFILGDKDAPPYAIIAAWKHAYNDDSAALESIVNEALPDVLERAGLRT